MNIKKLLKKRPLIMGILNITPDSFSDGGNYNSIEKAVKKAEELEKNGADIIDIGGESSGPGSKNVSEKEELKRVIKALIEIKKTVKIPISIDTYKAKVAEEAIKNGADIINDITALRGDENMAKTIAKYKTPIILMYSKDETARTTIKEKNYKDVTKTIINFLKKQINKAEKEGIPTENIIIDPGMGQFISSIPKYSFELIANIKEIEKNLNKPVQIGISRKSFLGKGTIKEIEKRSKIAESIAYFNGASIIRTHNVKLLKQWLK